MTFLDVLSVLRLLLVAVALSLVVLWCRVFSRVLSLQLHHHTNTGGLSLQGAVVFQKKPGHTLVVLKKAHYTDLFTDCGIRLFGHTHRHRSLATVSSWKNRVSKKLDLITLSTIRSTLLLSNLWTPNFTWFTWFFQKKKNFDSDFLLFFRLPIATNCGGRRSRVCLRSL